MKKIVFCSLIISLLVLLNGCVSNRTLSVDDGDNTIQLTGKWQAEKSGVVSGIAKKIKEDELSYDVSVEYSKKIIETIKNGGSIDDLEPNGFCYNNSRTDKLVLLKRDEKELGRFRKYGIDISNFMSEYHIEVPRGKRVWLFVLPGTYNEHIYTLNESWQIDNTEELMGSVEVWMNPKGKDFYETREGKKIEKTYYWRSTITGE